MTEKEVNYFEKIQAQLVSIHSEISMLSKKSSNDALNKFKLKFVNQTLSEANNLLGSEYKPFNDFEKFDDNDLPTNSDVTLILGQYLNCMEKLRADNVCRERKHDGNRYYYEWYWLINNQQSEIKTKAPEKITK
jgi:hypothetical protein